MSIRSHPRCIGSGQSELTKLHRQIEIRPPAAEATTPTRRLPLVSVGIPTFNRPEGLRRTLCAITEQTYENLEIIVSDNASTEPSVARVAEEFRSRDNRVRVFRQPINIGPKRNFSFVLGQATGKYFMWAADDDSWERNFVNQLVALLEADDTVGIAFCSFDARDSEGRRADIYPDFLPLLQVYAGKPVAERLSAYISQEEFLGKANLIYGLFRRSALESAGGMRAWGLGSWGADMLIACNVLARTNLAVSPELLYHVGTEPLRSDANVDAGASKPASPRLKRVIVAIGRHAGYMIGYARIVAHANGLSLIDRMCLFAVILRRLAIFVRRDLVSA